MIFHFIFELAIGGILVLLLLIFLCLGLSALALFISISAFSVLVGGLFGSHLLNPNVACVLAACLCLVILAYRVTKFFNLKSIFDIRKNHIVNYIKKGFDIKASVFILLVFLILFLIIFIIPARYESNQNIPTGVDNIKTI